MSDSLWPYELQHARPPCPSPTPGVHSNSRPLSRWCHPAISSSVVPFSSCPQSLPASESFPISQLFAWGGQSTGVLALASFLPKNTQDWSPLEWTGWISLQSIFGQIQYCCGKTLIDFILSRVYNIVKKKRYSEKKRYFNMHSRQPCAVHWASLVAQLVKNPPAMRETWVQFLGWEDPL